MSRTLVSLDIETTGLEPGSDEIIEIAAIKFRGKQTIGTFHSLVNPHRSLPHRIRAMTGITQAEVDTAPSFSAIAEELISFIGSHPIVGHSVAFDLGFLSAKGVRFSNPAYDTFDLASLLLPQLWDYSLASVVRQLGLSSPGYHRALLDATAAKEVFLTLMRRASKIDLSVIAEITRLTVLADWQLRPLFLEIERAKLRSLGSNREALPVLSFRAHGGEQGGSPAPKMVKRLLEVEELASVLEPGGPLERAIPAFEHRPEQISMMQAVAQALNDDQHLIVEAGTGTGKSIAYLLPAVFFALQNDARVVISTNTINLQEQLMGKDIPDLLGALGLSPSALHAVTLKGRANYLCLRRWDSLRQNQALSQDEIRLLIRTLVWLASTLSGDRADFHLIGNENAAWSQICAQEDNCLAEKCPYYRSGDCFLYHARRQAERSHLIVVNHALLLSDLSAGRKILPEFKHLVIDEAQHLEGEATEQFGFQVGPRDLFDYLNCLSRPLGREGYSGLLSEVENFIGRATAASLRKRDMGFLIEELHKRVEVARVQVSQFFEVLSHFVEAFAGKRREYEYRLRLTRETRVQPAWRGVEVAWENLSLALREIETGLGQMHAASESLSGDGVLGHDSLMVRLSSLIHSSSDLRRQINSIVVGPEAGVIYWVSLSVQSSAVILHSAPLEVGPVLEKSLLCEKDCVVLTSATLASEGSFDYVKGRLGLRDTRELLIGAPFDYLASTMMYVPQDIPEPGEPGYQRVVERALVALCRAVQGRTLVLFTSHASLRATRAGIQAPLEKDGILVLGQGVDGTAKGLLTAFKATPKTVLLGTSSLWEGVDVVGKALSVLVMVKLPFSVPTDPVFAARAEMFDDAFNCYALPQAVLKFKQGFGRLIRSRTDRGVMVVLDRRIHSRYYGKAFLKSLPLCAVRSGPALSMPHEVAGWLGV